MDGIAPSNESLTNWSGCWGIVGAETGGIRPSPRDLRSLTVLLDIVGLAVGGDGIGRAADGRVVFVPGALPGESVRIVVTEERTSLLRGEVAEILTASPDRQEPWCPHLADGCGGCGWQHVRPESQASLKRSTVVEALRRTAKLDADMAERVVRLGSALPDRGHRTTVRAAVMSGGEIGMRAHRSDRVVPITTCGVAHPLLDAIVWSMEVLPEVDEVEVRVGVASGERTVRFSSGDGEGNRSVTSPPGVLHETIAGARLRVSPGSFFQTSAVGAEALVEAVDAAAGSAGRGQLLIDLYGGVGLFAATVGERFEAVTLVELAASSCSDARFNLAGRSGVEVVQRDVNRWRPTRTAGPAPVVIADPARRGLDRGGVATIAACRPSRVVLVSCDVGSFGRDVGLLTDAGFSLHDAVCLDIFPNTPHVEVVSTFLPTPRPAVA